MRLLSGKKREADRLAAELAAARDNERQLAHAMCSMYAEMARLARCAGVSWPRPDAVAPCDVMAVHVADMAAEIREAMGRLAGDAGPGTGGAAHRRECGDRPAVVAV